MHVWGKSQEQLQIDKTQHFNTRPLKKKPKRKTLLCRKIMKIHHQPSGKASAASARSTELLKWLLTGIKYYFGNAKVLWSVHTKRCSTVTVLWVWGLLGFLFGGFFVWVVSVWVRVGLHYQRLHRAQIHMKFAFKSIIYLSLGTPKPFHWVWKYLHSQIFNVGKGIKVPWQKSQWNTQLTLCNITTALKKSVLL